VHAIFVVQLQGADSGVRVLRAEERKLTVISLHVPVASFRCCSETSEPSSGGGSVCTVAWHSYQVSGIGLIKVNNGVLMFWVYQKALRQCSDVYSTGTYYLERKNQLEDLVVERIILKWLKK
jgi:hypothetical protein